jgi:flagellar basal-body rod modification protein FlgD
MEVTNSSALESINKQASTGNKSNALSGLTNDFESFLQLFLTQLQNQDPSEPLDTNQMTDQIVQFTQVEQQINTNTKLDAMITAQKSSSINNALGFVDKFVEFEGSQINFNGAGARSEFAYKLDGPAQNISIAITDATGKTVRKVDNLDGTVGKKNSVVWDGTDDAGNHLEAGVYNIKISAKNSEGNIVGLKQYVTDYVTSVDLQGTNVVLNFGALSINANNVSTIKSAALYQAPPAAPAGQPTA